MKKKTIFKYFTVFEALLLFLGSVVAGICIWQAFAPEKQQKLSELPEEECIAFLISNGAFVGDYLDSEHYGELIKEIIVKIEENPYDPLPYNDIDVVSLEKSLQKTVNKHYDIHNERPPLSELPGYKCLEFIASRGIEIPPALKTGYVSETVIRMIERAEKSPYSQSQYSEPDESFLYESIVEVVDEYYDIFEDNPRLSELADAECFEFLASHGIEIPPAARSAYMGDFIKWMIAGAENHPYAYPRGFGLHLLYHSESIRKVVNEYNGIYKKRPKLSELSAEECAEFITSSGVRIPAGIGVEYLGEYVKEIIAKIEERPYSPFSTSRADLSYFYDSVRKTVNEYYFLHYNNYDLEWQPEFEQEYYDSLSAPNGK